MSRGRPTLRRSEHGQVILFMDNPNFRGFWYGTNGLFLNAVHFGPLLGGVGGDY